MNGEPGENRTLDVWGKNPLFYLTELPAQNTTSPCTKVHGLALAFELGASGRHRTADASLFRGPLYHLSYRGKAYLPGHVDDVTEPGKLLGVWGTRPESNRRLPMHSRGPNH